MIRDEQAWRRWEAGWQRNTPADPEANLRIFWTLLEMVPRPVSGRRTIPWKALKKTLNSQGASTPMCNLKDLAQALNKAGIPYMVIGGQAVLACGEPHLTRDMDVTPGAIPEAQPLALGKPLSATFERMFREEVFDGNA